MAETKPTWIAAATGAGFASLLTQIVLARELLVVFLGHELTLGIIFGIWLVGAAFGSFLGRSLSRNIAQDKLALTGAATLALLAMLPLPMIFVARGLRLYFAAGVGEFLPIGAIFAGCAASLAPVCIPNGFLFPIMCHGASKQKTQAVARIYAADAFGSLIAGLFFTFVLAWRVSSIASALIVSAAACAAAACLLNRRPRLLAASAAVLCVFIAAWPGVLPPLEQFAANWRWRAFGIINPNSPEGAPSLVMERESRYQNIALLEAMGQAAIYGNGQVLFSFPDRLAAEFNIHQCMAQNPKARRVLLLGGNPVDDVRELLRYPLESLVHVELDGMTSALVRGLPTEARLTRIATDAPHYVKTATNLFDVILLQAPAPLTVGQNRCYTVEFYKDARRRLTPSGFFFTTMEASEHLHDETAVLAASILRTLEACFPTVLVAAAPELRCFAGFPKSNLTLDASELEARCKAANIKYEYFRPEFFEQDETLNPQRIEWTHNRLSEMNAPINTGIRPVAFRYALALWSRISGSSLDEVWKSLDRMKSSAIQTWIFACSVALLLTGVVLRRINFRREHMRARWASAMAIASLAGSGFAAMAIHLMILVHFQNLLGHMYAHLGLLAAASMSGMAIGALFARRMMDAKTQRLTALLFAMQILLGFTALLLLCLALHDASLASAGVSYRVLTGALAGMAAVAGFLAGARFPIACEWLRRMGFTHGSAAAWANAADLTGAGIGSLLTGLALLSVLGFDEACRILAALQLAAGLAVLSGATAMRKNRAH